MRTVQTQEQDSGEHGKYSDTTDNSTYARERNTMQK